MRIVLCTICFVLTLAVTGGQAQQQPEPQVPEQEDPIAGFYESQGVGVSGKPYQGFVEIVKRGDGAYSLQWLNDGQLGVGIVRGETFAVSFFGVRPNEISVGVALYKIELGQLVGEWVSYGESAVYPETLIKTTEVPRLQPEKPKPPQSQPDKQQSPPGNRRIA